jgi:hypothetical protein
MMNVSKCLATMVCVGGAVYCLAAQAQAPQPSRSPQVQVPRTGAMGDQGEAPPTRATAEPQAPQTGATSDPGEAPPRVDRADVPRSTCRPGYVQQGFWLCMTGSRGPASFANAVLDCSDSGGQVADYHDWRYRIFRGDGSLAPVGWWLGPITADNTALFVNQANVADYDGETSRFDSRNYACAHHLLR